MRLIFVPLILIGWPLAEIAGFVVVGRKFGLLPTLGLAMGSGVLGVALMRSQGMHLLQKISLESREGRVPAGDVIDGAMIVVAGMLLLLPGFLSDIIGIALFIPFIRRVIWKSIGHRVVVRAHGPRSGFRGGRNRATPIVDLSESDFHREPDPKHPSSPPDPESREFRS